MLTARYGYVLSSRKTTLKRGLNSLIQVYSSWSDSSSLPTMVHSTLLAACTIACVFGSKPAGLAKYEFSRDRRFFALPT
ncbi:hypothetical protein AHiyo1_36270 [Arthrobacter sp. Hiyo1]|nr:hypothetical protein AHiyo1_36270 [Arthrobacter sp. Hiyo1]